MPKRVGFLELFFDLVFVFAVTQLVSLLHGDHTLAGWGRAGLMMWLVWWAWSQYAWAGNAIDLERRRTRIAVLAITGAMLVAAAAIPTAFSGDGAWFAVPYVVVRAAGLALYWAGLSGQPSHRAALRSYLPVQMVSLVFIGAGGIVGGDGRIALWLLALVVDVVSAISAGRGEFRIDPAHFAERHGLIVIIALGESVVAIGATVSEAGLGRDVVVILAMAAVAVGALWWCYFDWVHGAAEHRLANEPDHRRRGRLARDLFTLGHLPIVAGVVVVAAGVEEALVHPTDPLPPFGVTALAVGPGLYLVGFVIGNLRATGAVLWPRAVALVGVVALIIALDDSVDATVSLGIVALVLTAVGATESVRRV